MFLFSFIKTGTINYMSPEVIRDTSSQSGKARSKVLLQSFISTHSSVISGLHYNGFPLPLIDQSKRRRLVPWMYLVQHDIWKNSIPEDHQSNGQNARHHWSFPQHRLSWNRWEGLAACTKSESQQACPSSFKTSQSKNMCSVHKGRKLILAILHQESANDVVKLNSNNLLPDMVAAEMPCKKPKRKDFNCWAAWAPIPTS